MTDERTSRAWGHYAFVLLCAAVLLVAYNFRHLALGVPPRRNNPEVLAALCLLGIAVQPLLSERRFRIALLALSVVGAAVQLGFDAAGILAFSALAMGLSRLRGPTLLRVLVALAAWVAGLLPKLYFSFSQFSDHYAFYMLWAGTAFSAIYLIVERSRGALDRNTWLDDLVYLIALPRLLTPFFQPLSPTKFWASRVARVEPRLALRGLGLGVLGIALFLWMRKLPYIQPPRPDAIRVDYGVPAWLVPAYNVGAIYASNASAIFCAVGLFRLLGFDLGSGFNFPFASRSFAEFFRRWNYYIYELVRALFFFPLLGRLRNWLPEKVALAVSSYLAIFFGTFGLNAVVVPVALEPNPVLSLQRTFQADFIGFHALYWTGIILPQLLPRPRWAATPTPVWRVVQHALFFVLITLLTRAAYSRGVAIL